VQGMFSASGAILLYFNAPGVITPIFFGGVVPFFAVRAGQGDDRPDIFFGCHVYLP